MVGVRGRSFINDGAVWGPGVAVWGLGLQSGDLGLQSGDLSLQSGNLGLQSGTVWGPGVAVWGSLGTWGCSLGNDLCSSLCRNC